MQFVVRLDPTPPIVAPPPESPVNDQSDDSFCSGLVLGVLVMGILAFVLGAAGVLTCRELTVREINKDIQLSGYRIAKIETRWLVFPDFTTWRPQQPNAGDQR